MESIYSNIKARRKELRLTQQELADSLGYERSSIAKIEKGQVDLPLSKMRVFAEKLGLPLAELLAPFDQLRCIRHYTTAAAAGYAAPIEGEDYELIPCGEEVPARADFCIEISGDSMEPYIHDGQRIYVKRDESLRPFEVGVFFVDGDVYCKQWCVDYLGTTHLLSANPAREDASLHIERDSGRSLICFGKVLLKQTPPAPVYW